MYLMFIPLLIHNVHRLHGVVMILIKGEMLLSIVGIVADDLDLILDYISYPVNDICYSYPKDNGKSTFDLVVSFGNMVSEKYVEWCGWSVYNIGQKSYRAQRV